jgi:hypothetical protein
MLTVFALEVDTETVCFAKLLALAYEACTKFKLAFKFLTADFGCDAVNKNRHLGLLSCRKQEAKLKSCFLNQTLIPTKRLRL